jgi:Holliday junction resolvase RusA-like endonuclease
MRSITFVVPGQPEGKGRPRSTRKGGHYTPPKTVIYENKIMTCFQEAVRENGWEPAEKPVSLVIYAFYPVAESKAKKKKEAMLLHLIHPTKKPDIDNVAKAVLDGLNGVAWKDDKQVTDLMIRKRYGTSPQIVVTVAENDLGGE